MKITVIANDGKIINDVVFIYSKRDVYANSIMVEAANVCEETYICVYENNDVSPAMEYIRNIIISAEAFGRDRVLINLYDFDNMGKEDTDNDK
ncbi:hypothetical protein [Peptostreptococcus sp. D1]|uniref:hypothetical protein n=1 Tax=Peptostreptococcus sp. D1 TaxID=72304 RepID=UPI0008EAE0A4|nr:hypothetical protein [Peptostreptococcus sp. D1]SFE90043.1 hypothetical protein SAMN02910278_02008 [Peptostreptococcus sp. D1]